jgi:hypothetical protein
LHAIGIDTDLFVTVEEGFVFDEAQSVPRVRRRRQVAEEER